jgi:hypothetical protein
MSTKNDTPLENTTEDQMRLQQLRSILFPKELDELSELKAILDSPARLDEKMKPVIETRIETHLEVLKKQFPKEFSGVVNRMIEQKIQSSQTEIMNMLSPIIGQMVANYVRYQFQILKDNIADQLQLVASRGIWWHLRNRVLGLSDADLVLSASHKSVLEEIFIIERDSGLLMASAALHPTMDRDVVAGMLTAIKAFVEDAFGRKMEELEMVQYGTYCIIIQNFHSYYVAIALKGTVSTKEKEALREAIRTFVMDTPDLQNAMQDNKIEQKVSLKLKSNFIIPQEKRTAQWVELKSKPFFN